MSGFASQLAATGLAFQLAQRQKQSIAIQNENILSQYGYSRLAESPIFTKPKSYTSYIVGPKGGVIGVGSNELEDLRPEEKREILAAVTSGKLRKLEETEGTYSAPTRNILGQTVIAYVVLDKRSQIRGYFTGGIPTEALTDANLMPKPGEGSSFPSDQPLLQNKLGVFRYTGYAPEILQTTNKFKEEIPPLDQKYLGELYKLKNEVHAAIGTNWRGIESALRETGRLPEKVSLLDEIRKNRAELKQLGTTPEDLSHALWSLVRIKEVADSPNVGIALNGDHYAVDFELRRRTHDSSPFSDKINQASLQIQFTRLSDGKRLVMNSELIRHIENASFFRSIQLPSQYDQGSKATPLSYKPSEVAEFLGFGRNVELARDINPKNSVGKLLKDPSQAVLISRVEELTALENAANEFGLHPLKGKNFRLVPDSIPAAMLATQMVISNSHGATDQTINQLELKYVKPSSINSSQLDSIRSISRPDLMLNLLNKVTFADLSDVEPSNRLFSLNPIFSMLSGKPQERELGEKLLSLLGKAKEHGGLNIRAFAGVIKTRPDTLEKFDQDSWVRLDRAAPYLRSELSKELGQIKIPLKHRSGEFFKQALEILEIDQAEFYFKNVSPRPATRNDLIALDQIYKKVGPNTAVMLTPAENALLSSFHIDKKEIPEANRRHSESRYNPIIQTLNGSVGEALKFDGVLNSLRPNLNGVVYARAKEIIEHLRYSSDLITPIRRSHFVGKGIEDVEAFSALLKKEKPQSIAAFNVLLGQYLNPDLTALIKSGAVIVHSKTSDEFESCTYRFNEQQFKKMPGVKTQDGKSTIKVGGLDISYSLGELTVGERKLTVNLKTKEIGYKYEGVPALDLDVGPIQ